MNSKQWWDSVKNDSVKFNDWLVKQYRGEVTAATRIRVLKDNYPSSEKNKRVLEVIASQEEQHAGWVLELLVARGINPSLENAEKRYWAKTLQGIKDFATGTAVGAHAEGMRLERIKVICEDEEAPADVRVVFQKILKDELFHERAFTQMSTPEALESTRGNHLLGKESLGLEA